MLSKEQEIFRRKANTMSNLDQHEDNQSGVKFNGTTVEATYNKLGNETFTALGFLHAVDSTLNSEGDSPQFNLNIPEDVRGALKFEEENLQKIQNIVDFLNTRSTQFGRAKEVALKTKVFDQINTVQLRLEKQIKKLTLIQQKFEAAARPAQPTEVQSGRHLNLQPLMKPIAVVMTLASLAFLGGVAGPDKVSANDGSKLPDNSTTISTEDVQSALNSIDHNLMGTIDQIEAQLSSLGMATTHIEGGGLPPDPELTDTTVTANKTTEQTQPESVQAKETDPEAFHAEALSSVKLTKTEWKTLNSITPEANLNMGDVALSGPLPTETNNWMPTEPGSPLDALMKQVIAEGASLTAAVKQENPDVPPLRMILIVHRNIDAGFTVDVTPVIGLNQSIDIANNTLSAKTLIALTGKGLRYLDIAPRSVNGQLVTTDEISVIRVDKKIVDQLAAAGITSQPEGSFILAQVEDKTNILESVLAVKNATILFDEKTGLPVNPQDGQSVVGVATSPAPEVKYQSNEAPPVVQAPLATLESRDGKQVLVVGTQSYETTSLRLGNVGIEPGISIDTGTASEGIINVDGYVESIERLPITLPAKDSNGNPLPPTENAAQRDVPYFYYKIKVLIPAAGNRPKYEVIGYAVESIGLVTTENNTSFKGTPTPEAIGNIQPGQEVRLGVRNLDETTFLAHFKRDWGDFPGNEDLSEWLRKQYQPNYEKMLAAFQAGTPLSQPGEVLVSSLGYNLKTK